eukprot:9044488-Alexandrium_andersonii.AAC.1
MAWWWLLGSRLQGRRLASGWRSSAMRRTTSSESWCLAGKTGTLRRVSSLVVVVGIVKVSWMGRWSWWLVPGSSQWA